MFVGYLPVGLVLQIVPGPGMGTNVRQRTLSNPWQVYWSHTLSPLSSSESLLALRKHVTSVLDLHAISPPPG